MFLHDAESDELVFEAVSGEGERSLVGTRMPSGTGVAGWVLTTREPLIVNYTTSDSRFSREAAERTGFVPTSLMCAPLLHGDQALGVINVLDRPLRPGFVLEEIDLLGQFAHQAALALVQLQRARRVQRVLAGESDETQAVRDWPRCLRARRRNLRHRIASRCSNRWRGSSRDRRMGGPGDDTLASRRRRARSAYARGRPGGVGEFVERYSRYVTRLPLVPIGFVSTMRRTSFRRFSRAHTAISGASATTRRSNPGWASSPGTCASTGCGQGVARSLTRTSSWRRGRRSSASRRRAPCRTHSRR